MSRIILHIGMPKTGATALQLFFVQNKEKLAEKGILFPSAGSSKDSLAVFRANALPMLCACASRFNTYKPAYRDEEHIASFWPKLKDAIPREGTVLLSSEHIFEALNLKGPNYVEDYQNLWVDMVQELRSLGAESINVILYLRERAGFAESWWKHQVKCGRAGEDYVSALDADFTGKLLDYHAHVLAIEQALESQDRLLIRKYGCDSFAGEDNYHDFCHAAGIPWDDSFSIPPGKPNVSLTNDLAEAMRGFSHVAPFASEARDYLRKRAVDLAISEPAPNTALLAPKDYEERFSCYEEGDCAIARQYFDEELLFPLLAKREVWQPDERDISEKKDYLLEQVDRYREERYPAKLLRISTPGYRSVELTLQLSSAVQVKDVLIKPEGDESGWHCRKCPYKLAGRGAYQKVRVSVAANALSEPVQEQRWTLMLALDVPEGADAPGSFFQRVSLSRSMKMRMMLRNQQLDLADGYILYPSWHIDADKLVFVSRKRHKGDTWKTKAKELAAFALCTFTQPYWKRHHIKLMCELNCMRAQDNAYYLFKYIMEHGDEQAHRRSYFVLDEDSADLPALEPFRSNTVPFMSFRHMLYICAAEGLIESHGRRQIYLVPPVPVKPSIIFRRTASIPSFFLQHGVTAIKDVSDAFSKTNERDFLLCTSAEEQKTVTSKYGYSKDQAPVLGLPRWDALSDERAPGEPMILISPTHRPWLRFASEEEFKRSSFYRFYDELINSGELHDLLGRNNGTAVLYLHPLMKRFTHLFSVDSDHVQVVHADEQALNKFIKRCSLALTDYSSVCWDVLYMNKPVVFFQFDEAEYRMRCGNKDAPLVPNLESVLPGPICRTAEECVDELNRYFLNGFTLSEEHNELADDRYAHRDHNNSKRIYNYLKNKGWL